MTWLVWRQYRAQGAIAFALLAAVAVVMLAGDIDALLAEQRLALKRENVALEELVLAYMGAESADDRLTTIGEES